MRSTVTNVCGRLCAAEPVPANTFPTPRPGPQLASGNLRYAAPHSGKKMRQPSVHLAGANFRYNIWKALTEFPREDHSQSKPVKYATSQNYVTFLPPGCVDAESKSVSTLLGGTGDSNCEGFRVLKGVAVSG